MKLKSSKIHKTLLIARRSCEVLLTALIIVLMFPTKSSFKYEFSKGQFWKHENLISPIDFAIKKTDAEIIALLSSAPSKQTVFHQRYRIRKFDNQRI